MIYYKANEEHKVLMHTNSSEMAKDYKLTETCADDGLETAWDGSVWVKGYAPEKPHNEVILEQIKELESQITDRNLRGAILGDEFATNKITQIEAQIDELRHQLESGD